MKIQECFVGIDVSKLELQISVLPLASNWAEANDEDGWRALVERLRELRATLIVLEATGGHEVGMTAALAAAGLPVVVMNPRPVRDFAKASGKLAKTDYIDAQVLAHFVQVMRPEVRPLKDEQSRELDALFMRRRQIVDMLTMEKNRLALSAQRVRKGIRAHITWLERRLDEVDGELKAFIRATPVWREKDAILQSVPGVGAVMSAALLSQLPELGKLNRRRSVVWSVWRR